MLRFTGAVCLILLLCQFDLASARARRDKYKDESLQSKTPADLIPEECKNDPDKGTRIPVSSSDSAAAFASADGEGTDPRKEIHRVLITFKLEDDPVLKWVEEATGGKTELKDATGEPAGPTTMSEEEVSAFLATQGTGYWFDQATLQAWFDGIPFLEQVVELVDSVFYGPSTRILILNLKNKEVAESVVGIVKFSGLVEDVTLDAPLKLEESRSGKTNDPKFKQQWGMKWIGMDGSFSSSPWSVTTGDPKIVVAVMDTGIDYKHPDLKPNMWKNKGEIPGNGIDDDGNGYVDDVHGFSFVEGEEDKSDVMDGHSHGTHCAGIIAAEANNKQGIAGVAPDVSLMSLKVFSASGDTSIGTMVQALEYAVKMKVPIISASLGGSSEASRKMWNKQLEVINRHNILFVAAAGNEANNNDVNLVMPCGSGQPNVICVASAFKDGCLSAFSNYGKGTVDIVAPGTEILSTVPKFVNDTGYAIKSGTSMATPFVSGAAALILSTWKQNGDKYLGRGREVKEILLKSAKTHSKYKDFISSGAALDVPKALKLAKETKQGGGQTYDGVRIKSDRFDRRDKIYSQQPSDRSADKFDQRDRTYSQQSSDRSAGRFDRRDQRDTQQRFDRNPDGLLDRRDRIYIHQNDGGAKDYHGEEQFDRQSGKFDRRDQIYNQHERDMPREERVTSSQGHANVKQTGDVGRQGFSQQVYDRRSDRWGGRDQMYSQQGGRDQMYGQQGGRDQMYSQQGGRDQMYSQQGGRDQMYSQQGGRDQMYSQQGRDSYPRYERVQGDRPQQDRRDGSNSQQYHHG